MNIRLPWWQWIAWGGFAATGFFFPSATVSASDVLPEEYTVSDTPERELYGLAGRLFDEGNYPAAAKTYHDFVDRFPNHPRAADAQMMLAESLYRQTLSEDATPTEKSLRDARNEYKKTLGRIPKGDHLAASAEFRLGEIEFNLGHYGPAIEAMERLQAEYPGDLLRAEAKLLEAQSLLAQRKTHEAYRTLQTALKDQPAYQEEPRMSLAYGIALFEVGNSSQALKHLEGLDAPIARLYAARAHLELGKPLVAEERLRKIIEADPQGPLVELSRYLIAEAFFTAKDYLSANLAYEQFLRSYSTSALRPAATYKIGLCQYERGEYLAARGSFQSVLQLAPQNEFAELSLYMIAESFMKEGRLKEANFGYAEMAATYSTPLTGDAQFKQGWTHFKQSEYPQAETALQLLLVKYPQHPVAPAAALLLGNALTHQERYADAVRAYQRSLDLLDAVELPEDRKTELREADLALLSRANLLGQNYGSLVSGYQYLLGHVKPTLNPWRAMSLLYIAEGYYRQGLYDQAMTIYRDALNSFPASPEAALAVDGIAWTLFAKGKYAEAEREREKLIVYRNRPAVAPSKTVLNGGTVGDNLFINNGYEIAASLFNQKKYLDALDAYEGFEKSHPDHPMTPDAALQSGWCYYRLEHYGQALKAWERVETTYSGTPVAVKASWAIADTYFRAGKYDEAVATYQRILQTYPQDPTANFAKLRIAQCHYNAKDVLKAITEFAELLQQAPKAPEASQVLDFLTQLLYQPEAKAPALEALTRIADSGSDSATASQARFRIARYLYETADYAAAVDALEKAVAGLSGQSELMDAQFYLAESYYQLKRYQDSASAYERFTSNFPGDKRFAAALFHLGASRFKTEDFTGAADAFQRLAADYPSTSYAPVALFNSALAYRKLGKWEEAALALKTYLKKYPEEAKTSNATTELAEIYDENKQYRLLISALLEEREALPADDARRLELSQRVGDAYAAQGDDVKAEEEYKTATESPLKDNPFRLAALAKLGEYYEKTQRWAEAEVVYSDLARHTNNKEWAQAAQARAQSSREKLVQSSAQVSSMTFTDKSSPRPRSHKKKQ